MRLEQSFDVAAPVDRVWRALIDVEKVAPCLPGAAVTGRNDDGSYDGSFTVKIGPTSASYAGKLTMEQADEDTHTAKLQANGTDKRGQGSAKASIVSRLSAANGDRTHVEVVTDYHITGRLARFGRGGMIEDISEKLLRQFAERLAQMLEGPGNGASADAAVASGPDERSDAPTVVASSGAEEPAEAAGAALGTEHAAEASTAASGAATATVETEPRVSTEPVPSEPLEGLSLVGSVLWDRARRSPAPFAFIAGLLLAFILLGRRKR